MHSHHLSYGEKALRNSLKKIIFCITTITLLITSGCSIGAPVGASSNAQKDGLTVWVMQDDFTDETIQAINREFTKQTGVKVNLQVQPWDGIDTKVTTALSTANPPDIIDMGNTKILDYAMSGGLLDLSGYTSSFENSKYWIEGLEKPATYNNKLYGIPAFAATRTVIYNKKMWQEAGVTQTPTTYNEFVEALTKIQKAHTDSDFSALYMPGQNWFSGMQYIWDAGGELAIQDGTTWKAQASSSKVQEGLQRWAKLQHDFSTPASQTAAPNNPDQAQILAQGRASAILWNSASINKAIGINNTLTRKDFGTFPMPSTTGKGIMPSVVAGSDWAIPARSANASLAITWISIATSEKIQEKWIMDHDGWLPNNTKLLEKRLQSDDLDETLRGFYEAAIYTKSVPAAPGWSTIEADGSIRELFSNVAQNPSNIKAATQAFDNHANKILAQGGSNE
ncbi:MAG: extracellular solute-binding protein [Bifidobacteriaceae bacterium]|nr:extracellular solute-binding protein [Bifidobacteriaceae bacterium]